MRVIVTRMQQVQQRRKSLSSSSVDATYKSATPSSSVNAGPSSLGVGPLSPAGVSTVTGNARLSDTERASIRQKIAKMAPWLPRLDALLNDGSRRPPLTGHVRRQLQTIVRTSAPA